ncbi:hypothetical protein ACRAKI_22450 [Saccharothrix isguenensis]
MAREPGRIGGVSVSAAVSIACHAACTGGSGRVASGSTAGRSAFRSVARVDVVDGQAQGVVDGDDRDAGRRDVVPDQAGADDFQGRGGQSGDGGRAECHRVGVQVDSVAPRGTGHVPAQTVTLNVDEDPIDLAGIGGQPVEVLEDLAQGHRPRRVHLVRLPGELQLDQRHRQRPPDQQIDPRTLQHRVRRLDPQHCGVHTGCYQGSRGGEPHHVLGEQPTEPTLQMAPEFSGHRCPHCI